MSISPPHVGHDSGKTTGVSSPVRSSTTGASIRGMMSPAFHTMTVSPIIMPLSRMNFGLCRVAYRTTLPSTSTGSSTARGAMTPVRPTFHSTARSFDCRTAAASLYAVAQCGWRLPNPARSCSATASALMTTPSIPNGNSARSAAISSTRRWTSSTVAQTRGPTGVAVVVCTPAVATASIISVCVAPGRPTTPYA